MHCAASLSRLLPLARGFSAKNASPPRSRVSACMPPARCTEARESQKAPRRRALHVPGTPPPRLPSLCLRCRLRRAGGAPGAEGAWSCAALRSPACWRRLRGAGLAACSLGPLGGRAWIRAGGGGVTEAWPLAASEEGPGLLRSAAPGATCVLQARFGQVGAIQRRVALRRGQSCGLGPPWLSSFPSSRVGSSSKELQHGSEEGSSRCLLLRQGLSLFWASQLPPLSCGRRRRAPQNTPNPFLQLRMLKEKMSGSRRPADLDGGLPAATHLGKPRLALRIHRNPQDAICKLLTGILIS